MTPQRAPITIAADQSEAVYLRKARLWDQAADAFQRILAEDPESVPAWIGLGDCLLHLNRPEEALGCFEQCRTETGAIFGKAVALQRLGRLEQSEASYQLFLRLHPESEEGWSNLIALAMERFELPKVERYAQRLLDKHPQSLIALQALTVVAFERRDYATAAGFFRRLRAITAGLPQAGSPGAIEYRLSRKDIEMLDSLGAASEDPYGTFKNSH